ncbi:YtxH domain-containing protein [Pedobacter nyackensis]|uniref:Gas vesicle protein n=1 Tax=Pedobacter nyackensis TaxID=475255 RepID=A0A1W2ESM8_9SPHI|nr:YtxH domain-containing protein [Pedobacter nyackensis]SMD12699.1 Gas vesicle protein [Pedobacter nyackensis]
MNYRKLVSDRLSNMSYKPTDSSGAIVALLTGLAVGAVLGVLFAPESGKRTRGRISDKASDAAGNIKDTLHTMKERISTQKNDLVGLKDRVVDNIKSKANEVSQDFKDFKDANLGKVKSGIREAADEANEAIQHG